MFKFLRKYNKWILAVGGTLLLITFLIPFAFTQLGDLQARTGATWATVERPEKDKVTTGELSRLQAELRLLQTLQQFQGPLLPGLGELDDAAHWYLLVKEAQDAGLVGGTAGLAAAPGIAQVAQATGQRPAFVAETLAKLDGVRRMLELYLDHNKLSDRRLKHEARRLFHSVEADVVVIEATEPADPPRFGDAELREQMETYADVAPGEGEMGFGYRLPDRVKLEWLAVDAESVRDAVAGSDQLNPVALREHWLKNPQFGPVEPTAAVPDAVRSDLLEKITARTLDAIAKHANDRLRVHRRGIPQRDGHYDLPEGWEDLSFQALALELQEEFEIPLPAYHAPGVWLDAEALADLEGIGTAVTDKFGPVPVALPEVVMAARELGTESTMPIQVGVSGPPLRARPGAGSIYLFRILEADPSRPPRSLEEVRERVTADLLRLVHYEQLAGETESLREQAIDEGLLAVAIAHDTPVRRAGNVTLTDLGSLFSATSLGPDSLRPTPLPVIGVDEATVAAIIDGAMSLDPATPMSEVPEAQRVLVLPVKDALAVIVVRLVRQTPLTSETFASYAGFGIVQRPLLAESMGTEDEIEQVFGYDALAKRHAFKVVTGSGDDDEDGAS